MNSARARGRSTSFDMSFSVCSGKQRRPSNTVAASLIPGPARRSVPPLARPHTLADSPYAAPPTDFALPSPALFIMPAAFLSFGLYTDAFVKTLNPDLESWLSAMEDVLVSRA